MPVSWLNIILDQSSQLLYLASQYTYQLFQTMHTIVPFNVSPSDLCFTFATHQQIRLTFCAPVLLQFFVTFKSFFFAAYEITAINFSVLWRFRLFLLLHQASLLQIGISSSLNFLFSNNIQDHFVHALVWFEFHITARTLLIFLEPFLQA